MRAMVMGSALVLVALLAVCSADPLTLACGSCRTPTPKTRTPRTPVTVPPITLPPVTVPPVLNPPVSVPPVGRSPVTVPPIGRSPVTLPPVTLPPVITLPPVTGGSPPSGGCPSPPSTSGGSTCSDLKLGTCLDVLGLKVQIGDPTVECCSPLAGLTGVDAALCLCTTIREKLLDINVYLPVALQLLVNTCGKSIPPGYTCP